MKFQIKDTCLKCGACAMDCPVHVIVRDLKQFVVGPGCIGCGDCYEICPVGAIYIVEADEAIH